MQFLSHFAFSISHENFWTNGYIVHFYQRLLIFIYFFLQLLYVESSEKGKDLELEVNELHSTWRNGFDFDAACKPWKTEPSLKAELI